MNVRNCRNCGRIFNYIAGPPICPACRERQEQKFQEVKDYIRNNKGVGINEVAEACDVEPFQIRQWLREDRLELAPDSPIQLACEGCGAPIRSGRFCDKCTINMSKGFKDVLKANQPEKKSNKLKNDDGAKMRFLK